MAFNLDRSVKYRADSEHRSLYAWSLRETTADGEPLGRDLVPWDWTLRFLASELRVINSFQIEKRFDHDGSESTETRESSVILAKLRIDRGFSSDFRDEGTKLSMLGCDREVTDVSLRIEAIKDTDGSEQCTISGCPSFTTEIDFRDRTFPDQLQVQILITPVRFRSLCELASASRALSVNVTVSRVSGLYSEWSPAIATDSVKILTQEDDHEVAELLESGRPLPRLGRVGEFQLEVIDHVPVYAPQEDRSALESNDEPSAESAMNISPISAAFETAQRLLRQQEITQKAIRSLATPLWIAVLVLIVMWLTR